MINYYDGTPGSGKSYHAVDMIVKKLQEGVNVITDISIDFEGYTSRRGKKEVYHKKPITYKGIYRHEPTITVPMLYEFAMEHTNWNVFNEHQHLVVIDEVYNYFDPRDFISEDRKLWIAFLKISRHLRIDFVLIGQHGKTDIDKKIMSCVDNATIHRSLIKLQWGFQLLCLLTGKWFLAITWACKKGVPSIKLDVKWVHLNPKIAGRYDSHHLFMDSSFSEMLKKWYEKHPEQFSKPFEINTKTQEVETIGTETGEQQQSNNDIFAELVGKFGAELSSEQLISSADFELDKSIFGSDNK